MTLRNFTPLTEDLIEDVRTVAYKQFDEKIAKRLENYALNNVYWCDLYENKESFYIEDDYLCLVCYVSGSHYTVRLNIDNLAAPNEAVVHFSASGYLTEKQELYEVTVYSQKGEEAVCSLEVFMRIESEAEKHFFDLGICDYAPIKEGVMYVADIDGDGIDEILLNLVRSVNGYTTTKLYRFENNELVLWHDFENNAFGYYQKHQTEMDQQGTARIYQIPDDYVVGDTFISKVYDVSVEDIDSDDDYEIKLARFVRWAAGQETEYEVTLDFIETKEKFMAIEYNMLKQWDVSQFESYIDENYHDPQPQRSFDEIWQIEYPIFDIPFNGYCPELNDIIKETVQARFEYLFGMNPNITHEHTKINYTITYSGRLVSFYYEIFLVVDTVSVVRSKLGFTFDPYTGERLYLSDFVTIDDDFCNQIKEKWYSQLNEAFFVTMDDTNYSKYILSSAELCDHKYSETSYYVADDGLYYICSVEYMVGSYHTLYFPWEEIWEDTEFYRRYIRKP